jgi:crossover junction endodeoxyribonuclease RusA
LDFRLSVLNAWKETRRATCLLPVTVDVCADRPDNRRRDLDNLLKPLLDAMEHAGVYVNDSQVHDLHIKWLKGLVLVNPKVYVSVEEYLP